MKVSEAIELLKQYDPEMDLFIGGTVAAYRGSPVIVNDDPTKTPVDEINEMIDPKTNKKFIQLN